MRRASGPGTAEVRTAVTADAFTLLELLTVVAIIGILVSMAFAAASGAQERSRRAQCRSELAVLAQAIEAYRVRFGDFPQTGAVADDPCGPAAVDDGPGILFNALAGRRGPGSVLVPVEARGFVPLAVFALQTEDLPTTGSMAQSANSILDPWGRRYLYFYKTGPSWTPQAPLLLSVGPDGAVELPTDLGAWDGLLSSAAAANVDNLSSTTP